MSSLRRLAAASALLSLASAGLIASCGGSGGESGPVAPPDELTATELKHGEAPPEILVAVDAISGASGSGNRFRVGDSVRVDFTLSKPDGGTWDVIEMGFAQALISGPTFNYQRVIAPELDLAARAVRLAPGRFRFTFQAPLPPNYLAPLNDSPAIGAADGELAGQALLDGTYTLALSFAWDYTAEGDPGTQSGEVAADFLVGDSAVMSPRAVVTQQNCERCHVEVSAHENRHSDVRVCVLCHTSGAEDLNDVSILGGTPGASVDARVLFHRIHNARYLPSAVGVDASATGALDYTLEPQAYRVVAGDGEVHDYSTSGPAIGPGAWIPMPRDFGFGALSVEAQQRDLQTRKGLTNCRSCHGDPDGAGPLVAPTQGALVQAEPSRRACGACHDDVHWDRPYTANQQTMEPQPNDAQCNVCHGALGGPLAVIDGHRHPLLDTIDEPHAPFEFAFNPGLHAEFIKLEEWGARDDDGTLDPGEGLLMHFGFHDDSDVEVPASTLTRVSVNISGPTTSAQLLHEVDLPLSGVPTGDHLILPLPERLRLERVGASTSSLGDTFSVPRAPLWQLAGTEPVVRVRVAAGPAAALSAAARAQQNFIDVDQPALFARDDMLAVDDGAVEFEEYLTVQFVDGARLWFSSPATPSYATGLRRAHAAGALVRRVTLETKTAGADYALAHQSGALTELSEFGAGAVVLVDATVDWVLPARYPLGFNASDELDETDGEWTGKALVSGTYRVTLQARRDKPFFIPGGSELYPIVSEPAVGFVGVIDGTGDDPGGGHDHLGARFSETSCQTCHQDLWYHGGRERGYERCVACHGTAAAEDRPRYVSANAPATPGVSVSFHQLVHRIHSAGGFKTREVHEIVGAGNAPYPDDYSVRTWDGVRFPAQPGGVARCDKCHSGTLPEFHEPRERDHPSEQGLPALSWRMACGSCHASSAANAHFDVQTSGSGVESCAVCHGKGAEFDVESAHAAHSHGGHTHR